MASGDLNQIHVNSSTGVSLNDRFTVMTSRRVERSPSNSRSQVRTIRGIPPANRRNTTSIANRRLLQQLSRRHKIQTAGRIKKRSMRQAGAIHIKRGSVKAYRVGANGRPMRTNSLAHVATMKADFIPNGRLLNRSRPLNRSNTKFTGQMGQNRPLMGGAAERVAQRQIQRGRSHSRNRLAVNQIRGPPARGRSRSRNRADRTAINVVPNIRRSRSRNRGGRNNNAVSIKTRLGVRPNANNNQRQQDGNGRNTSISRRGVTAGRIQRRRNSNVTALNRNNQNIAVQQRGGNGGRVGRPRSRSALRNTAGRSISRSRMGSVANNRQQGSAGRGRSLQRNGNYNSSNRGGRGAQRNGNGNNRQRNGNANNRQRNGNANNGQRQQRRGRSRSRSRGGGRPLGNKGGVNKDVLDKELDQYMSTSRNDTDFLLK